ncbi:MAG: T9SS type A sorting domain-containing protein [Candidatus Cloacimonetes bacterium]|nr:T9SS type A sorting domain-containing protein [Candidatus Cloacimonadota bacterium]MBL7086982.1 T9SS type A sorting domain-containing protein [Candidatus Cloacimonadota bacterium]
MKYTKMLLILAFYILYFILTFTLSADTIIDSVYSTPELDGYIFFSQQYQILSVNNWMYHMGAGDTGTDPIANDPNSRGRSYVSFVLPEIPEDYELDSVFIRLYQYSCNGNSVHGQYPDWNVPGGDTMFCIMDHIDYGNELDVSDWTKGDPGYPGTIYTNVGIISDSAEYGYRYFDITPYVLNDYTNSRDKTQYRIRFPIETDWDFLSDNLVFYTNFNIPEESPLIVLYFNKLTAGDEELLDKNCSNIEVHPNPIYGTEKEIKISFELKRAEVIRVSIYDIKGKIVKRLADYKRFSSGKNCIVWDCKSNDNNKISNGIYFCKFEMQEEVKVEKLIVLH